MTRILVAGATGLLGCTLTPYLRSSGYDVVTHAKSGDGEVNANLADLAATHGVLNRVNPDVILNLVALTNVDFCERNPRMAYLINVRVTENLTDWIRTGNRKTHLIQVSTDQVYDGTGPHGEGDVSLTNYYAFSKYGGELSAKTTQATIFRTNFFGPSHCFGRTSLSDWIIDSLRQGREITVFDDVLFSPLSMRTLREYITLGIEKRLPGVFNLGSLEGKSKADFAFELADVLNLPISGMLRGCSTEKTFDAYRPKDMRMDSTLFSAKFNVDLPNLSEEIRKMKEAYDEATK